MHALHELLCTDGRMLNRHAGKMYGFVPGIVTAVHDPKKKRHMRGYVKVHFPGLQDQAGPEAPILPWARFIMPNAGGMLEPKKTKKEKRTVPIWVPVRKEEPYTIVTEVEEPIYEEIEETKTDTDEKLENFQEQLDVRFKVDYPKPWQMDKIHGDVFLNGLGDAKGKVKTFVTKLKAKLKEAEDFDGLAEIFDKPKIMLDAHTSPTGTRDYNKPLSDRRASYLYDLMIDELDAQDLRDKVTFGKSNCTGWGRQCTGMGRHLKTLNIVNFDQLESPGYPHPKWKDCLKTQNAADPKFDRPPGSYECSGCRRVDVTAHLCMVKKKTKKTTTKKKVVVGYKKTQKEIKGSRVYFEIQKKTKDIEVEVPVPGTPSGTGFYSPPQIGDEVVCAFEHGDMHHPYVLGSVWNGKAKLPEPKTPADDKRDKKGPQTKPMKGDSLCGGGGKNKIGYFKSRTGNLVSLDDQNGVVRIQDKTGMSTIQLSAGKIEIMQSTQDIYFFAKETIRFDCKDFEVWANKNIWQHATNHYGVKAGKDNVIESKGTWSLHAKGGKDTDPANSITGIKFKSKLDMKIGADKMVTITGKGNHTKQGVGLQLRTTAGKIAVMSKDAKFEIEAKQDVKLQTLMKHASGCEADCNIKSDGGIDFNALMKIKWKGEKVLLNAGGSPAGALTLGKIVGAIIRGAKALAGKIASGAAKAAKAVAAKAQQAAAAAGKAVANSPLGKIVGAVSKAVNGAAKAIGGAAKNLGAAVAKAAGPVMAAAQNVANQAAGLANQALGAAAGIAGKVGPLKDLAAAAQKAVSQVGGVVGKLKEAVGGAAGELIGKIQDAGNAVLNGVGGIADQLKDAAGQVMKKIDQAVDMVKGGVDKAVGMVKDVADKGVGMAKEMVGDLAGKAGEFADKLGPLAGPAKQAIGKAADMAGEQLDAAGEKLKGVADAAGERAKAQVDEAVAPAREQVQKVADGAEQAGEKVDEAREKLNALPGGRPKPGPDGPVEDRWGNPRPNPMPRPNPGQQDDGGGAGQDADQEVGAAQQAD